jgi:acetyltransferase-like isoleucine patch superfamily enzyme
MKGARVKGIGNNISINYDAAFYDNSILEICERSRLRIGKNFTLSYSSLIACMEEVTIGDFVMIGEFTSIRDTTHSFENNMVPFTKQKDVSKAIKIGNNVWIGRGCIILPGTTIGDNVIIGANSVVKGDLQPGNVYAGAPLKLLRAIDRKEVSE